MKVEPALLGLFVCEGVLRDLFDENKLSFVNLFTGFTTAQLPFILPPVYAVSRYGGAQGEFRHHFEVRDNTDRILMRSEPTPFFLDNPTDEHFNIHRMEGIPFPHPGFYWILTVLDSRERARVCLNLRYQVPG